MERVRNFADVRQRSWCVHCGGAEKGSRDHVPSKVFLDEPYPHNLPEIDTCARCNQGFSLDEQYLACLLECVVCGTTEPERLERPNIRRTIIAVPKLRERLERARREADTPNGKLVVWDFEEARVRKVLLKLARGHALFELNEPMLDDPDEFAFVPLPSLSEEQRERFEEVSAGEGPAVWPEVGSRAMQRVVSGEDMEGGWIVVQPDRYRYRTTADASVSVKMVLRGYLAAEIVWNR